MTIDPGMATLIISVFLAIVGAAFGYGVLTNRVKGNRLDIDENKKDFKADMDSLKSENSAGHKLIHEKLDIMIRNGGGGAH